MRNEDLWKFGITTVFIPSVYSVVVSLAIMYIRRYLDRNFVLREKKNTSSESLPPV